MSEDFVITGNTRTAVQVLAELEFAFGKTGNALTIIKRKMGEMVTEGAKQLVIERQLRAAIRARADAMAQTTPAMRDRIYAVNKFIGSLRRLHVEAGKRVGLGFSPKEAGQMSAAIMTLRRQLTSMGFDADKAKAALDRLRAGKPVSIAPQYAAVLPILTQIVALEDQRNTKAQRLNDKKQQELAIQRQIVQQMIAAAAAQGAARRFLTSQGLFGKQLPAGTTGDEALRLANAQANYDKIAIKGNMTYAQLQEASRRYHTADMVGASEAMREQIGAYAAVVAADKAAGASRAATAKRAATAQRLAMTRAAQSYSHANKNARHLVLTWKSLIRLASVQIIHLGLGRFISAMFEASREMANLNLRIAEIRTISRQAQLSFQQWRVEVEELAASFGRVPTDVAEGVYQTLSNQVAHGTEAISFMSEALLFSRVAHATTAEAVNLGTAAINSFRLSSQDARMVYAQLMATIELGRVRAEEIATTFGRVGSLAHILGVEMHETSAMIATLSRVGIPVNETMTLMNQIFLKLIRPTKAMKEEFARMGVVSGPAAIRLKGMAGVFQHLEEAAQKSGDRLKFIGDIFSRVRAIRGGAVFDTETMEAFLADMEKIQNSLVSYQEQIRITFAEENTTVQLQKSWTAFKVYLMEKIIKPVMDSLAQMGGKNGLTEMFISAKAAIQPLINLVKEIIQGFKTLGVSVRNLITFWLAWKVTAALTFALFSSGFARMHVWIRLIRVAMHRGIATTVVWKTVVSGLATVVQVTLGVALAYLATKWMAAKQAASEALMLAEQASSELATLLGRYFDTTKKTTAAIIDSLEKRKLRAKELLTEQYRAYFQYASDIRKILGELYDEFEFRHKGIAKTIKETYDLLVKDVQTTIDKLKSAISAAESNAKSAARSIRDLPIEREMGELQRAGQEAKDLGALREYYKILVRVSNRWKEISVDRIKAALAEGPNIQSADPDKIKAANSALKSEQQSLLAEWTLAQRNYTKARQKFNPALMQLWDVRRVAAEESINELFKRRIQYQKDLMILESKRVKEQKSDLEAQLKNLVEIKNIFTTIKTVMGTKPSDKKGETTAELKKEFETNVTAIMKRLQVVKDPALINKFIAQIAEYSNLFHKHLAISKNLKTLDSITTELAKMKKEEAKILQDRASEEKKQQTKMTETGDHLLKATNLLARLFPYQVRTSPRKQQQLQYLDTRPPGSPDRGGTRGMARWDKFFKFWETRTPRINLEQYAPVRTMDYGRGISSEYRTIDMAKVINDMQKAAEGVTKMTDPAARARQIELVKQYIRFVRHQMLAAGQAGGRGSSIDLDRIETLFGEAAAKRLNLKTGEFLGGEYKPDAVEQESITEQVAKIGILATKSQEAATKHAEAAAKFNTRLNQLATVLNELKLNRKPLDELVEKWRQGLDSQGKLYERIGDLINKMQELIDKRAGITKTSFGIPSGVPGVNLANYMVPSYSSGGVGGGNSVTMGDINVTVQGGDTSQQTAEEIGRALVREVRRGTVGLALQGSTA